MSSNPLGDGKINLSEKRTIRLETKEVVNHPSHYGGDVPHEVIKCLKAWGLESDALLWNVVKYIARWDRKGDPLENLKKAKFYLDRKIADMEAASENSSSVR